MKLLFIFLASIVLIACNSEPTPVAASERFMFPRGNKPLREAVKYVEETTFTSDSGQVHTLKPETKEQYYFNKNGLLYEWDSWTGTGEKDLEYSDNGKGYKKTKFVYEKTLKEEEYKWTKVDGFNVKTTKVSIDGNLNKTIIHRYDSKYNILFERSGEGSDAFETTYTYKDGVLSKEVSVGSGGYRSVTSYGSETDTTVTSSRNGTYTSIRYINKHGDFEKILEILPYANGDEIKFRYEYDAKGNWVSRITTSSKSKIVRVAKRKITYHD